MVLEAIVPKYEIERKCRRIIWKGVNRTRGARRRGATMFDFSRKKAWPLSTVIAGSKRRPSRNYHSKSRNYIVMVVQNYTTNRKHEQDGRFRPVRRRQEGETVKDVQRYSAGYSEAHSRAKRTCQSGLRKISMFILNFEARRFLVMAAA